MSTRGIVVALVGGLSVSASALGVIAPFTETFSSPGAAWSTSGASLAALNYLPSGGPDGSGYGSQSFSFANNPANAPKVLFRAVASLNSSGGAFSGNYIAAGVTEIEFSVRHNAPVALDFLGRAVFTNSPVGGAAFTAPSAQPNVWTTYTLPINAASFTYEGNFGFSTVFSDVAQFQIGINVPDALAGQAGPYTFDIDNVRIVPAPSAAGLLGLGVLAGLRRRRA